MSFQLSRMGVIVYDFTAFSTSLGTFIACPQGVNVINILCLYNLVLHLYFMSLLYTRHCGQCLHLYYLRTLQCLEDAQLSRQLP